VIFAASCVTLQHGDETGTVLYRQAEQSEGKDFDRVGVLSFFFAGANRSANAIAAFRILL
jgi:hypothetical protein